MATKPSYPRTENPTGQDRITLGEHEGASQINKFAYRSVLNIASGDAFITADNITDSPTILTTASTFTITYNQATDGLGTTGALTLLFTYLDSDEDQVQAIHTLSNTGSDVTSFSGLGINRIVVLSSGSATVNTNSITAKATAGSTTQGFIPALSGVTQQLILHVPRNTKATAKAIFIAARKISGGGSPRVTFKIRVYSRITNTRYEVFRHLMDTSSENHLTLIDPCNFPFSPRDVVWITAATDVNNTEVAARLSTNLYERS